MATRRTSGSVRGKAAGPDEASPAASPDAPTEDKPADPPKPVERKPDPPKPDPKPEPERKRCSVCGTLSSVNGRCTNPKHTR